MLPPNWHTHTLTHTHSKSQHVERINQTRTKPGWASQTGCGSMSSGWSTHCWYYCQSRADTSSISKHRHMRIFTHTVLQSHSYVWIIQIVATAAPHPHLTTTLPRCDHILMIPKCTVYIPALLLFPFPFALLLLLLGGIMMSKLCKNAVECVTFDKCCNIFLDFVCPFI